MASIPRKFLAQFTARTRLLRESAGYTQAEMAKFLGVKKTTYVKYEGRSLIPHHLIPDFLKLTSSTFDYLWGIKPGNRADRSTPQGSDSLTN